MQESDLQTKTRTCPPWPAPRDAIGRIQNYGIDFAWTLFSPTSIDQNVWWQMDFLFKYIIAVEMSVWFGNPEEKKVIGIGFCLILKKLDELISNFWFFPFVNQWEERGRFVFILAIKNSEVFRHKKSSIYYQSMQCPNHTRTKFGEMCWSWT